MLVSFKKSTQIGKGKQTVIKFKIQINPKQLIFYFQELKQLDKAPKCGLQIIDSTFSTSMQKRNNKITKKIGLYSYSSEIYRN